MVIFAVILGVIVGGGAGLAKSAIDNSPVAVADESSLESDQINPFGADHELGQISHWQSGWRLNVWLPLMRSCRGGWPTKVIGYI